jgi:hypothetical protein
MHRLVIARFAEQLDWITGVPEDFEIVVYNKGAPITSPAILARAKVNTRMNIGRESDTYLAHIANCDTSPGAEFTVFTQGDPFEHSPDFIALLQNTAAWQDVQPLSWRWKSGRDIPPGSILARERDGFVQGLRVRPEIFSLSSWAPIGFDDPGTQWLNSTYRRLHELPDGINIAAHFLRQCGLGPLASAARGHRLGRFSYGALFGVRTALLRQLPAGAIDLLRQASCAHAVYGYVIERLWLHLFGLPFVLPLDLPLHDAERETTPGQTFAPPETPTVLRRRRMQSAFGRLRRLIVRG